MRAYSFVVTVASENLDTEVVEDTLRQSLVDSLPDGTLALVKGDGVKDYSEQGWKNARARVFGQTVKTIGDGHKAKKSKVEEAV